MGIWHDGIRYEAKTEEDIVRIVRYLKLLDKSIAFAKPA